MRQAIKSHGEHVPKSTRYPVADHRVADWFAHRQTHPRFLQAIVAAPVMDHKRA